jgi:hypothetical protein
LAILDKEANIGLLHVTDYCLRVMLVYEGL